MSFYQIDSETRGVIEDELYSGETLLWAGKSSGRGGLRRRLSGGNNPPMIAMLIGLMFTVIFGVVFVFVDSPGPALMMSSSNIVPVIMPLIFIILGLVVFAKVALTRSRIGSAIYAVTDQRALIISKRLAGGRSVQSYSQSDIERIERRTHRDGTGDLIFAHEAGSGMIYMGNGMMSRRQYTNDIGFFGISDAREVELLMLETFKMSDQSGKGKYKHDELADDGELIDEDEFFQNQRQGRR